MVTVNGEEAYIEVDERQHGQTEVNAVIDEGAYVIASFASPQDANDFADLIQKKGKSYKVDGYRLIDG